MCTENRPAVLIWKTVLAERALNEFIAFVRLRSNRCACFLIFNLIGSSLCSKGNRTCFICSFPLTFHAISFHVLRVMKDQFRAELANFNPLSPAVVQGRIVLFNFADIAFVISSHVCLLLAYFRVLVCSLKKAHIRICLERCVGTSDFHSLIRLFPV